MLDKRTFIAVDISEEARAAVAEYIEGLRREFPQIRARWLPPENLHITIGFVGSVDEIGLLAIEQRVRAVAKQFGPFDARLEGTGHFANRKIRADALWIGVHSVPENMFSDLAAGLGDDGERKFVPHLTIARLKDPRQGKELVDAHLSASFGPVAFSIDHLTIYESILGAAGSTYRVISRHSLG
jgi:2'-5' RNA ligase